MDETRVSALIADGENERIDFKRELGLKSAEDKAEFVKDVISLANSAPDCGYLLIGVENNKYVVGINSLEEERIQQIAHTYIEPKVVLRCFLVPMSTANFLTVGVIETKATVKPHKVARAIDKLNQDDVFIRRGSVVAKASPEEMFRMREGETQLQREAQQHIRAAETHLKLGNWQTAITAYSKAIEAVPTPESFLARGKAYELQSEHTEKPANVKFEEWINHRRGYDALRGYAHKDFSDAINLTTSKEVEREARLGRVRIFAYSWEDRQKDLEWLKANTEGYEYGKVLYWEVEGWEARDQESVGQEAIPLLGQAIKLGYGKPEVYYLRAEANAAVHNYGLALQDIDEAISKPEAHGKNLVRFLCLRAEILVAKSRFSDAYETLSRAKQLDEEEVRTWLYLVKYGFENSILCQCALAAQFGDKRFSRPMSTALEVLALWKGRKVIEITKESNDTVVFKTELHYLEDKCPGILFAIRGILGEELWASMENTTDELILRVGFPSIKEQMPRDMKL